MKYKLITLIFIFYSFAIKAQENLDYFLPQNIEYNSNIPTPEEFFGQKVGEWHLNYEQVLNYISTISEISDRATLQEYARSYENRPLVHLIFTSEKNHKNLETLKNIHTQFSESDSELPPTDVPLVVNLGYGVHGNESSATNSSVLTAYYLSAAEGEKIEELLQNTIILVDPCLNPDGFTRQSTWANMHQSFEPNGDPNSRQFDEVWPAGRTNHYWFDLNRDYLLLVHPESRGRIAKFHEWKPNIVTDHHEMGANSTFFFQPGVPSRNNPLTPQKNYDLTYKISTYHAQFLDEIGSTYFSEEQYDDYYFGKGSSYPDINGSIGILFEQAGFRGRIRETSNGLRKLAFGIKNQFTVTLSTLEAAMKMKSELLNFQKEFYADAIKLAEKDPVKAYVFGSENEKIKTQMFIDILNQHQIQVFQNKNEIRKNGISFQPETSYFVPLKQNQYRLIKSIFDVTTTFADSTFYDISTWTFPYSFNLPFAEILSEKELILISETVKTTKTPGKITGGKSNLAYLFKWNEYSAPEALFQLQKAGLMTKVATKKFQFTINGETEDFSFGTILLPVEGQNLNIDQIYNLVSKVTEKTGIDFYALSTGLSPSGIDLGSGSFQALNRPKILLFVGGSVSSSDAGEIWHLFDQRYHIPITLGKTESLRSFNLNKYNTIILPGGSYREFGDSEIQKLKSWVQNGGTLIALRSAASWAAKNGFGKVNFKKSNQQDSTLNLSYAERSKEYNLDRISGAIFNANIDVSHPLCYGYLRSEIPVFKTGNNIAESLNKNYSEPVSFTSEPYISGFISNKNLEKLENAPVVSVQSVGRGKLICYYESMTFRGIWLGTNKLFSNAVFFGNIIN